MFGEIIKILDPKQSRNGNTYRRVEFKMEDGGWAKTDLCYDYRNWDRWRKVLRVGNKLFNLRMKDSITVDADSLPLLLEGRKVFTGKRYSEEELCKMGFL
jgi:hypothetical protein